INRGERAKVLRVKLDVDQNAMLREAEPLLVPADHPHAGFLHACVQDALGRLIEPSLEREARREMTEKSEYHAVDVFVRNLRKLLLGPPVNGRRVLAVDPGFKSGCKLAALDEFGNVIGHVIIHVVGNEERRKKGREQMVEMIRSLDLSLVCIGNGTACRDTEQLVTEIIANELADRDVQYVIVNEAGASVYSTSPIGREEFPGYDPLLRSAISIGRRLLDPLSELVKINPANIGVGLYQHDVKAKHLRDSLDAVVESDVNFVGVDVNTASPALLRYVSGLNQLTARRLYEHRCEHGSFKNREEFKAVPGFGDAAFVQAAGFLKILGGDNPLDATWIHPESYSVAEKVLERLNSDKTELAHAVPAAPQPPKAPAQSKAAQNFASNLLEPTVEGAAPAAPVTEGEAAPEATAPVAEVAPEPVAEVVAVEPTPVTEEAAPQGPTLAERAAQIDVAALTSELQVGELLLRDILASLMRPGRDPREDLSPPLFRRGIMKLEDLEAGMELQGTVLNVVDFGAFVDIGLSDSGLVHISRLADRYVKDPHEVVGVGDVLKVWVVEVDKQRRRVSLTAIEPGTERPPQPKREKQPRGERPARPPRKPQGAGQPAQQGAGGPPAQGQQSRPPRPPRPAATAPAGSAPATGSAPPASRPPFRGGGMSFGSGKGERGPAPTVGSKKMLGKQLKVKKKVKPQSSLTPEMEKGNEPMRSFSDLLQFKKKKTDGPDDQK
ncbi:MAG TPA: helix-hairpin-helix domain-containing protein, partial [Pirellulaceae bacterium]|nr:helix-hairpin-helix domain-containing protein [Pirellulaceae bacterium]